MKILAIDTSSEACSAALNINGEILTKFELAPQQHANYILCQIDQLVSESEVQLSQLDAIAFGKGPGSFTGLRIAAGVTQGIAYGSDLPVIGVSTLSALAQQCAIAQEQNLIFAAIDARMNEAYCSVYSTDDSGLVKPLMEEIVAKPSELKLPDTLDDKLPINRIGTGFREFEKEFATLLEGFNLSICLQDKLPSAKEVSVLAINQFRNGAILKPELAIPTYLRNDVAKKSAQLQ